MKKILLFITAIITTGIMDAQVLQPAINIGPAFYNAPSNTYSSLSVKVIKDTKHLLMGAALDMNFGTERVSYNYTDVSGVQMQFKAKHTAFGISPNIFANYKLAVGKGYVYAGADAGIYYHPETHYYAGIISNETLIYKHIMYRLDIVCGAQAGYTVFLSRSIGINIEGGWRNVFARSKAVVYFPVLAGVKFRIQNHKPEPPEVIQCQ